MDQRKNSILIVDDEPLNITALSHILSADYTIYVEKDGEGCIESAKELKPDLILLDIIMPEMNGYEVIKILKEDDDTRDIPVMFVTGLNNAKDEEYSFSLGACDFINKPFSAPVVKLRVKNQMQMVNHMQSIKELGLTDILTGVGSRRNFQAILAQEWQRANRNETSVGLMILDIHDMESLNAKHGHSFGDTVLKKIVRIIEEVFKNRQYQMARWGSDEFAIVLPYATRPDMEVLAQSLQQAIHEFSFDLGAISDNVIVSIGANAFAPVLEDLDKLDLFISQTVLALEEAQRGILQGNSIHLAPKLKS